MFLFGRHLLQWYRTFLIHDNLEELLPFLLCTYYYGEVLIFRVIILIWIVMVETKIDQRCSESWTMNDTILQDLIPSVLVTTALLNNSSLLLLFMQLFLSVIFHYISSSKFSNFTRRWLTARLTICMVLDLRRRSFPLVPIYLRYIRLGVIFAVSYLSLLILTLHGLL